MPPSKRDLAFTQYLAELVRRHDAAALAALRRGLGKPPGSVPEMYPYVYAWVGDARLSRTVEQDLFTVASLFAFWHQGRTWPELAGSCLGDAMRRMGYTQQNMDAAERRFRILLDADRSELPERLRHSLSLLRAHDVPIDWAELLQDMRNWEADDHWVQRKWARAFWAHAQAATDRSN